MSSYLEQQVEQLKSQIAGLETLKQESPDMTELADQEITELQTQLTAFEKALAPQETTSNQPGENIAILEIRSAAGGEEAKLWGEDLLRMYFRYAQSVNIIEVMYFNFSVRNGKRWYIHN